MEKEITIEIKKPEIILLLMFLCIALILELKLTIPSPIAFGDEGFHTRMAQWIAEEKEYPIWYPFIGTNLIKGGFNRPPLWNILEGSFYYIFGFNDIIVKFLTPFIGSFLIGIAVFVLVKKIYNKKIGLIASIILTTLPTVVTYSVLFYTDTLITFYFCLFVLTYMLSIKTKKIKYWILAGIFGAFVILAKSPGVVIVPLLIILFFFYKVLKGEFSKIIKNYLLLFLFLILISGTFFIRNLFYYGTPHCNLPFFSNKGCQKSFEYKNIQDFSGGVVGGGTSDSILKIGIVNYLNFVYGRILFMSIVSLPIISLIFICGLFFIGMRRKAPDILIFLMILVFLPIFYISITARSEDLARVTLSFSIIVALVSGIYLSKSYNYIKNLKSVWMGGLFFLIIDLLIIFYNYVNFSQILGVIIGSGLFFSSIYLLSIKKYKYVLIITFISFIILFSFFNLYEKVTGMVQIKQFVPSFFDACNFIKQNTTKDALILTVWDYATVYNCQRNVFQFTGMPDSGDITLSGNLNLTLSRLKAHGATHIFVQKFSINSVHYPPDFVKFLEANPKNFVKIYDTGPKLEECLQAGGCDGNTVYQMKY